MGSFTASGLLELGLETLARRSSRPAPSRLGRIGPSRRRQRAWGSAAYNSGLPGGWLRLSHDSVRSMSLPLRWEWPDRVMLAGAGCRLRGHVPRSSGGDSRLWPARRLPCQPGKPFPAAAGVDMSPRSTTGGSVAVSSRRRWCRCSRRTVGAPTGSVAPRARRGSRSRGVAEASGGRPKFYCHGLQEGGDGDLGRLATVSLPTSQPAGQLAAGAAVDTLLVWYGQGPQLV